MKKNYLKKGFIAGLVTGIFVAVSFLGYLYYLIQK